LDWRVPHSLPQFPADIEQGLYRVAQEALENIVRHAGASRVQADWTLADGVLTLSIRDNGCGFELSGPASHLHFGLRGMRERAQMIGGELDVASRPGQGTLICLKIKAP